MTQTEAPTCPRNHGTMRESTVGQVFGLGGSVPAYVCDKCLGVWIEDRISAAGSVAGEAESKRRRSFYAGGGGYRG